MDLRTSKLVEIWCTWSAKSR